MVCAVIDESVLRRSVGGHEVRIGQLKHMQHLARLRSTTIQVLPMACEDHSALEGPFILLTPGGGQQLAYLEVRSTSRAGHRRRRGTYSGRTVREHPRSGTQSPRAPGAD
ncbi:DUF5753 domain-containing protein [Streptomyces sp. NBC_01708]|uniref:Scr1 family TA system antitoxin-like transcriptional regulator n=1 Tax=Streptomyces sp. NPDC094458 TaxID=3155208 RepID=UPI002E27E255|nr:MULTISPECIES: Scr1 family TA system antitoxin-like transcriptional regulator [unclassified Streptomyces]WSS61127.1 DUF5753 domain-containing protein [Streptomyces sp. NBC_01177]